ncbi:hypothetical protein IAT38_002911 [Cryptococcus sp. DSM 104549]
MTQDSTNLTLQYEFDLLEVQLRGLWYQHGYPGLRYVREHFSDVYKRFMSLLVKDGDIEADTAAVALKACADLAEVRGVPKVSWFHIVISIRLEVARYEPLYDYKDPSVESKVKVRPLTIARSKSLTALYT